MQWETHSTRETPVLTLCCSNGPCWGRREERFGVSGWEMLLPDTRGRLSTSHVRWQGGDARAAWCSQGWGLNTHFHPPMKGPPVLCREHGYGDRLPLSLRGCTDPTARGICPPTQAGTSSTFPEQSHWGVGAAGGWEDPTGHRIHVQRWGLPMVHPQTGSLGQGEAGGGGRQWGSVNGKRAAWTEVPGPDPHVHEHRVPVGLGVGVGRTGGGSARVQESREIHREGTGARGAGSWKGRRCQGRMLSLPGDLHFLVVTNAVSEDVDLQEKRRQMVRPVKMPHAWLGMRVGAKVHRCSFFPSGSCVGFSMGL